MERTKFNETSVMKYMDQKSEKVVKQSTYIKYFCQLIFCMFLTTVYGCVTTSSQSTQVNKVVKSECVDPKKQSEQQSKIGCGPKGVIEISENYSVSPAVREEFHQAVSLLEQEKYEDAIRLLKAVSGKASKFTSPYINLGIAYQRISDFEKAEESLNKAIELNKHHPVANNELGLVYRQTKRYTEARTLYENLLSIYPDFLPAHKNLGVLCDIYIQDLECALREYEEYLKAIPDDKKVNIWIADVKSRM